MEDGHGPHSARALLVLITGLPGTGKSSVAEMLSTRLHASVLSHDWAMSGLRPYPEIQAVLDEMDPSGHRVVGWSILTALARSQLRLGRSVILDGVARSAEIAHCRDAARGEDGQFVVISTLCSDRDLHRSRLEGRERRIPNWYELSWSQVEQSLESWVEPEQTDLRVDSARRWDDSVARIASYFSSVQVHD